MEGRTMLVAVLLVTTVFLSTPAASDHEEPEVVLEVENGEYFYDSTPQDDACAGDTNDHTQGEALRHWHVGIPFQGRDAEFAGGFGCLGGPTSWTVTVPQDHVATVEGWVTYLWDQNVPGGGFNDVHLHILDEADDRVYSTYDQDGYQPMIPQPSTSSPGSFVVQPGNHTVNTTLEPGTYELQEDVFAGEHTAWLTNLEVTVKPAGN